MHEIKIKRIISYLISDFSKILLCQWLQDRLMTNEKESRYGVLPHSIIHIKLKAGEES